MSNAVISFVGAASAATTTLTFPAHQAGDLIVMWAYRAGNNTAPTIPAGVNWTTITSNRGNNGSNSFSCAAKIAASSSETSGTWTNATFTNVSIFRGTQQTVATAIGDYVQTNSTTTSAPIAYGTLSGAIAAMHDNATSWVAAFAGTTSASYSATAPTGMTNRSSQSTASGASVGHDTNGIVSSWTSASSGANVTPWISFVFEIIAAPRYTNLH